MSERKPEIKIIGLVAAKPWYSFLQLNLITIETIGGHPPLNTSQLGGGVFRNM